MILGFLNGEKLDLTGIKEANSNFDLNERFQGWKLTRSNKPKNAPNDACQYTLSCMIDFDYDKENTGTAIEILISLYSGSYSSGNLVPAVYLRTLGWADWNKWVKLNLN